MRPDNKASNVRLCLFVWRFTMLREYTLLQSSVVVILYQTQNYQRVTAVDCESQRYIVQMLL